MSLQTVPQPDPNSCFCLLLAPFPTHVDTSPSGKEIHKSTGSPAFFPVRPWLLTRKRRRQ